MEHYVSRLETTYKHVILIQNYLTQVDSKVKELSSVIQSLQKMVELNDQMLNEHTMKSQDLIYNLDDMENWSSKNNIHIMGLPETVFSKDFPSALSFIFNKIAT